MERSDLGFELLSVYHLGQVHLIDDALSVLGGLGSMHGAIVAGILLGMQMDHESVAAALLGASPPSGDAARRALRELRKQVETNLTLQYGVARALADAETLTPHGSGDTASDRPRRLLAAARMGSTRLIDNIAVMDG